MALDPFKVRPAQCTLLGAAKEGHHGGSWEVRVRRQTCRASREVWRYAL